jgi:hypothetical protein
MKYVHFNAQFVVCLFLWLCSPARAMASCGSAAQRGLWPPVALQPSAGYGLLVPQDLLITHNVAPQLFGLLWTSDQLVAETSTLTHSTQNNTNRPTYLLEISNICILANSILT